MRLTTWLFLRLLALVCLVAFVSYGVQIEGLIGSEGLLPIEQHLERIDHYLEAQQANGEFAGRWQFPTLCWVAHGDAALQAMVWGGALLALLLALGFAQGPLLLTLWLLYLSLLVAGQTFLSFQWDILLLETLFLSCFVAPWSMKAGRWRPRHPWQEPEPARSGIFLLRFLLFKLMFLSGVVKLLSMDDAWWQLSALDVHYFTQPIPAWTSWYAHQLPAWFQRGSVFVMFVIELVVPFFVFGPRRLRLSAFAALVGLQLLIAATGNYGFFNLLTVVLCIPLLDDRMLLRVPGVARFVGTETTPLEAAPSPLRSLRRAAVVVLLFVSSLTVVREMVRTLPSRTGVARQVLDAADRALLSWGQPLILEHTDPWRTINGYGLFRAMTLERPEIVIEGSADGIAWHEYEFRWKPGDPTRRPRFTGPHMPRLDWQMWFAALDPPGATPWLLSLARALLEGNATVLSLLDEEVLAKPPPRFVRFQLYDYRFTTPDERRSSGEWWHRTSRGLLMRSALTLEDFGLASD